MGTRKWSHVYIAAASGDLDRVTRVRAQLVAGGLMVTSRWIDEVTVSGANPSDITERKRRAESDMQDVNQSDVMLFLVPDARFQTRGAWFELGYAHHAGLPFISAGRREDLDRSVFTALGEEFEHDVDAIIRLLRIDWPDDQGKGS